MGFLSLFKPKLNIESNPKPENNNGVIVDVDTLPPYTAVKEIIKKAAIDLSDSESFIDQMFSVSGGDAIFNSILYNVKYVIDYNGEYNGKEGLGTVCLLDYEIRKFERAFGYSVANMDEIIKMINDYATFQIFSDYIMCYSNDDSQYIRSSIDGNTRNILFIFEEYQVAFVFYKIKKIITNEGTLSEYLESEDDSYIYNCDINIRRGNGKETKFSYALGNYERFNYDISKEDILLLELLFKDVIRAIKINFDDILENFIELYTGVISKYNNWELDLCSITGILNKN